MLGHSCQSMLCETPHESCDCDRCDECHKAHIKTNLLDTWGICLKCADVIAWDIERGFRCKHGAFVPDGQVTDKTCNECEESYEYAA